MLADRYASSTRLSSVFAREFCPLCVGDEETTQKSSGALNESWTCPECSGPVDNAEDIICMACLHAYSFRSFAAE
jgi:hypothetical protein